VSHLAFLNSCFIKYMLFCIHKITCVEEVSVDIIIAPSGYSIRRELAGFGLDAFCITKLSTHVKLRNSIKINDRLFPLQGMF